MDNDKTVDKFDYVRKWSEDASKDQGYYGERKWDKSDSNKDNLDSVDKSPSAKEVNNNKIKDRLNKFEHLTDESASENQKPREKRMLTGIVDKDGLKGKLKLFEQEIREQEISKKEGSSLNTSKTPKREVSKLFKSHSQLFYQKIITTFGCLR